MDDAPRWVFIEHTPDGPVEREVQITANGLLAPLSAENRLGKLRRQESDLLEYFLDHAGLICTKQQLCEAIWGPEDKVDRSPHLGVLLTKLRKIFPVSLITIGEKNVVYQFLRDSKDLLKKPRVPPTVAPRADLISLRPKLDRPFTAASGRVDFTYRTRTTPFVGRNTAIAALHDFLNDSRPGLWTVISGPAGVGKNRLAAELIAEVSGYEAPAGEWCAGFLLNAETWLRGDALKWAADAHALIVIDYASRFDRTDIDRDALRNFLAYINTPDAVCPGKLIRVLLIDRLPPENERGIVKRLLV